jgi:predicted PurR-regulated permease PerM
LPDKCRSRAIRQGVTMATDRDFTTVEPDEDPQPNLDELATFLRGPLDVRSIALSGLFLLAVFVTLYVARSIFMPVVLALLMSFLLAPLVGGLVRLHLPTPLGAAIVLLTILAVSGYGAYWLSGPAARWVEEIPQSLEQLKTKVQPIKESVAEINKATQQVETLAKGGQEQGPPVVEIKRPPLIGTLFSQTLEAGAAIVVTIILLYFLLASGDLFLQKLVRVLPRFRDKRTAVTIVRQIEKDISLYLLTVTITNAGLGIAVGIAMYGLGMPNPILWGVMVGCLNFIPYLGDITSVVILIVEEFSFFRPPELPIFPGLARSLRVPRSRGWTARVKRGKNVSPLTTKTADSPGSVRPHDCRTLAALERLQADLC